MGLVPSSRLNAASLWKWSNAKRSRRLRRKAGGRPAHQFGRIGRQEIVAGSGKIDVPHVGRIQTHAIDAAHDFAGQSVEQCNLAYRVFHDDAGGMQFASRICLAFQHADVHAFARQFGRAGMAREAGADYRAVGLLRQGILCGLRRGLTNCTTARSSRPCGAPIRDAGRQVRRAAAARRRDAATRSSGDPSPKRRL